MTLDKDFLIDEVRDDFYISGRMKRCWASQLVILGEVDKLCRKYGITYYAEWGTLLGTVRHGGYIPWDDDMDICMKRDDYDCFKEVSRELPEPYAYHTCDGEYDYWDIMGKVANSTRINFDEDFLKKHYGCPYALGIDVFPLDYIAPTPELEKEQYDLINYAMGIGDQASSGLIKGSDLDFQLRYIEDRCKKIRPRITDSNRRKKFDEAVHGLFSSAKDIRRRLYHLADRLFAIYSDADSDYLGQIGLRSSNNSGAIYPKKLYGTPMYLPFEGFNMPVPPGYEAVLKSKYGDFMKLVKDGGASTHDYPCFKRQEEQVKKAGINIPVYEYDSLGTHRENCENLGSARTKNQIIKAIEVLPTLHKEAVIKIESNDEDGAITILTQCQQVAVQIGNLIEKVYGADCEAVHSLEAYCEGVFEATSADNTELMLSKLTESYKLLRESLEHDLVDPEEVLFIVSRAKDWENIEYLYKKEVAKENTNVKVMPIPYYFKSYLGNIEDAAFEIADFDADLPLVSYKEYDFTGMNPDRVYIQQPYDQYHDTVTVHPDFYSDKLLTSAKQLILVPPVVPSEVDLKNLRAVEGMKYYAAMPGSINADMIILKNEKMKKAYIEYLSRTDEEKGYWENKIVVLGDNVFSGMQNNLKRKILVYISQSFCYENNGLSDDKIARVKRVFENEADRIETCWVEKEEDCSEINVNTFDAYYGSPGVLAHRMRMAGKPVMIINVEV